MKNVTVSLDDELLRKSREFARVHGKSFNELVREILTRTVEDGQESIVAAFLEADRLGWQLPGGMPSREERNAR